MLKKSSDWFRNTIKYLLECKEIRDYNCTLVFDDGLGGIASGTTIVHVQDDRDPTDSDTESKNIAGFPIFTMMIFSAASIILIKKRLKPNGINI